MLKIPQTNVVSFCLVEGVSKVGCGEISCLVCPMFAAGLKAG